MKEYFGKHSLRSLVRLVKSGLDTKVNISDIINNLNTADPYKPLAASQGKALKDLILRYDADDDGVVDNAKRLGGREASEYALKSEVNEFNVEDQKGQPDGIAPLNANGKVDTQYLPSYVDETVDVYIDPSTGKVYSDAEHTTEITEFSKDKIYHDVNTGSQNRWGGESLSEIPDTSDMVEITATAVQEMWDSVFNSTTPVEELGNMDQELSQGDSETV